METLYDGSYITAHRGQHAKFSMLIYIQVYEAFFCVVVLWVFFLFIHFILFYFFPMNMCRSYTKSGKSASHGLSRLHIPFLSSRVSGNCGLEQLTFCRLAPALAPAQPLPTSRASWKERPCKLPLLEEPAVNSELSSDHICQESGCSVPWNTCQVPRHPGDGMCWKCGRSP